MDPSTSYELPRSAKEWELTLKRLHDLHQAKSHAVQATATPSDSDIACDGTTSVFGATWSMGGLCSQLVRSGSKVTMPQFIALRILWDHIDVKPREEDSVATTITDALESLAGLGFTAQAAYDKAQGILGDCQEFQHLLARTRADEKTRSPRSGTEVRSMGMFTLVFEYLRDLGDDIDADTPGRLWMGRVPLYRPCPTRSDSASTAFLALGRRISDSFSDGSRNGGDGPRQESNRDEDDHDGGKPPIDMTDVDKKELDVAATTMTVTRGTWMVVAT